MSKFVGKYKKLIKEKPYMESVLILTGVCSFAFISAIICKNYGGGENLNTEVVLVEEDRAYYEGDYDKVLKDLESKKDEVWPTSILKAAKVHSLKGDLVMSNSLLEKSYIQSRIAIDKASTVKYTEELVELSNGITFTYLINGEVEKAIEYGEVFLNDMKKNEGLKELLATAYILNGKNDKAIEFIKTIELDLEDSYKLSEIAELYITAMDYNKGVELLRLAYNEDEENINVFEILKDYRGNKEIRDILLKKEDEVSNIFLAQMDIDTQEGIDRTNKVKEKTFARYVLESQLSEKSGDEARSKVLLEEIESEFKETYGGAYLLAKMYLAQGNIEKSTGYANKAIELNKDFGKAYGVLFPDIIKKQTKNVDMIASYLRDGIEKNPYSVKMMKLNAEYYNEKASFLIAHKYYSYLCVMQKYNEENYINKALIEFKDEDKTLSIKTIEDAIAIEKENSNLYNFLGVLYMKSDDGDKAIKNIRKAFEIDENNIKALNNAAVYYTKYDKNIARAFGNIKTAKEIIEAKGEFVNQTEAETIRVNYSLIEKAHEEFNETNDGNWNLEMLELLM